MMLWALPLVPIAAGGLVWLASARGLRRRVVLGAMAAAGLLALLALALWCAFHETATSLEWGGGLALSLQMSPVVGVAAALVPLIALPVVTWAAAHEDAAGLGRLLGLLVAFVGTMELLVLAGDLLTLAIGWELVAGTSWALIGHRWRDREAIAAANYAFNVTRLGGFGIWLAAAAALAGAGELGFAALPEVARGPWGDAMVAGVLVAAASKSAQGPFAPWLFRAMEGPSAASALLHSSTMVAAGAWVLIRLHEPLGIVSWFGPAAMGVGLATALGGGVVASLQPHAKRLLAASTSAQFGFMFAAVGAGYAGAGLAHLVTHAALKSLLFLAAGSAMGVAGSAQLRDMRLGSRLPVIAAASAVGALALAGIPPLGAAWSKEQIVAAAGHASPWLALVTIAAGALSAWYATRFHRLAFGTRDGEGEGERASLAEGGAVWGLAALCLLLALLWLPGVGARAKDALGLALPEGKPWELVVSIGAAILVVVAAWIAHRPAGPELAAQPSRVRRHVADWLGAPALIQWLAVGPVVRLSRACARLDARVVDAGVCRAVGAVVRLSGACARFDARVVDAGVRGAAWFGKASSRLLARVLELDIDRVVDLIGRSGVGAAYLSRRTDDQGVDAAVGGLARGIGAAAGRSRGLQTGSIPTYYSLLAGGILALAISLFVWR